MIRRNPNRIPRRNPRGAIAPVVISSRPNGGSARCGHPLRLLGLASKSPSLFPPRAGLQMSWPWGWLVLFVLSKVEDGQRVETSHYRPMRAHGSCQQVEAGARFVRERIPTTWVGAATVGRAYSHGVQAFVVLGKDYCREPVRGLAASSIAFPCWIVEGREFESVPRCEVNCSGALEGVGCRDLILATR